MRSYEKDGGGGGIEITTEIKGMIGLNGKSLLIVLATLNATNAYLVPFSK